MELIDRKAAIDAMNSEGYTKNMRVHKKILSIPAVDAVPVVRCGKCKHLSEYGFCMNPKQQIMPLTLRCADWFCADGEKKEEEE